LTNSYLKIDVLLRNHLDYPDKLFIRIGLIKIYTIEVVGISNRVGQKEIENSRELMSWNGTMSGNPSRQLLMPGSLKIPTAGRGNW